MKLGWFTKLLAALTTLSTLVFLTGCGAFGGDQNTFAPKGEVADKQKDFFWSVVALIIAILVEACSSTLIRYRYRRATPPKQVHGSPRLECWTICGDLVGRIAVPT
jgi:heme/copper-type cytochrome/quinol oxidase subunit 2